MLYGLFVTEPRIINARGGGGATSKIAPVYEVLRMSDIICQYCLNINFCNSKTKHKSTTYSDMLTLKLAA